MNGDDRADDTVDLELRLHDIEGAFSVAASCGQKAESEPMPLTPADLERLAGIGKALSCEHLVTREAVAAAGEEVFAAIFRGGPFEIFVGAREEARRRGAWLRILISLPERSALHEIPWEILRHGGAYLVQTGTTVCRHVRRPERAPLLTCPPPVRMLLTTAAPEDAPALDLEGEEQEVRAGVGATAGRIRLEVQRGVSAEQLAGLFEAARAAGDPFRIWHHVGHGEISRSGRYHLVLARDRQSELVEAVRIGQLLTNERDLKLAVLSLCYGGTALGLGVHLARLDVPAVVAFRGAVVNSAAVAFAKAFYANLAVAPLDVAVRRARGRLGVADDLDWTQPILYARSESLSLFDERLPAGQVPSPQAGAITFRTEDSSVRGQVKRIGRISIGERSVPPAVPPPPVEFISRREDADSVTEVGAIEVLASEAGEWRDLLAFLGERR